jgi:hypothetical protein
MGSATFSSTHSEGEIMSIIAVGIDLAKNVFAVHENFNGLFRQYLPMGTCRRSVTQAQCDHIAEDLNNRPRKRLGFKTPAKYHRK